LSIKTNSTGIKLIARFGLAAKGIVYCLIGLLAFMSAFHIGGQRSGNTDKQGAFKFIFDQPGGEVILGIIAFGLLSYSIWRFIQTFLDSEHKGGNAKGLGKRLIYFFSGLTYLFFSWLALKFLLNNGRQSGGSSQQDTVSDILNQPAGQWLLAAVALILAGIGIYQIWYGNSEKYRKHVNLQELDYDAAKALVRAGKVGYISRGIVWLVIAFLSLKAALHNRASEAGDTASAFTFVENSMFGTYLLAALGLGLICYGVLNFLRARFERF
jgi:hypothetical protein